ncbi:sugar ABC transporter substrate-binding protein [Microbacterium sp. HMH0099]|uniref:sugar ABC transporter substrate-binding protein n=1 Tax=Microbacterium sp. HMH0099 TaxID=3414026 RepID=UPI003BF718C2
MRRFFAVEAVASFSVAALILTGCSSSAGGGNAGATDDTITVGFAIPAANQTYWTAYQNGVKDEAEKQGVKVLFADAKDDANAQVDQVSSFLVSGVDGVVIAPTDTVGPLAAVAAVSDAGLPLITSNRVLDTTYGGAGGALPEVHVGFDDVKLGELQGELLVDACAEIDPCDVALLMATLGSSPQIQRTEGLKNVVSQHSNITLVDQQPDNFDSQLAQNLTATFLQQYPDLDFVLSQYDENAVAAAQVVSENGKADQVKVIGIGGSKNGVSAIEDGSMLGTVWVSPVRDGVTALQTILALINDDDLSDVSDTNGVPTIPVGAEKVTKDNASQFPGEW